MNDYDYVVLFDENGQPYISHAFGDRARAAWSSAKSAYGRASSTVKRAGQQAHKYLDKIQTRSGTFRYFYDPDELKAFLQGGRHRAKETVEKAKQTVGSAASKARETLRSGTERARTKVSEITTKVPERLKDTVAIRDKATGVILQGKEAVKKIEEGARSTAERVKEAGERVKDKVSETVETVKDKVGVDELQRFDKAVKQAQAMVADIQPDDRKTQRAVEKVERLFREYAETPLGKIQIVAAKATAIAKATGALISAIPSVALMMPLAAATIVVAYGKYKIDELKPKVTEKIDEYRERAKTMFRRQVRMK